ncbi:MAG: hypothetical protein IIW38_02555, partial [Alistipes sp.]|nr:hypothetical protein [Alistipes sp.]
NGGRSREQTEDGEAEAGNEVASIGQIDKKKIYLLLDYRHKAYNCKAIRLRLHIADKFAEAQQADRVPSSNENRAEKSARLKCG